MQSSDQNVLRTTEVVLAVSTLFLATVLLTDLSMPFPAWPEIGGVPVNPELVVPGVLGLVALVETTDSGLDLPSVVVGLFAVLTLSLSALGLYALWAGPGGGVFAGSLFTLAAGTPLSLAVLVRHARRKFAPDGFAARRRNRDSQS